MSSDKEVVYVNTVNNATERTQNFDANWKFYLGDAGNAQTSNFDDSKWRNISLPHDYSIEQEYSKQMEAESGYLPGGTGWYRKHFTVANGEKQDIVNTAVSKVAPKRAVPFVNLFIFFLLS